MGQEGYLSVNFRVVSADWLLFLLRTKYMKSNVTYGTTSLRDSAILECFHARHSFFHRRSSRA